MRSLILLLALLAPQCAFAQGSTADAEAAKRAMEEAKRQEDKRLQHPIFRYPEPVAPRPPSNSSDDRVAHAAFLELQGRGPEAVKIYARAARGGNVDAARRLAEIYFKGIPGVERDYVEAEKWTRFASELRNFVR